MMGQGRFLGLGVFLLAIPLVADAQARETGFLDRSLVVEGSEYLYQVYVPRAYEEAPTWPVILYLHGCGPEGWGDDGIGQTRYGLADAIRGDAQRFPAVVVLPQVPYETHWLDLGATVALSALEETLGEFRIDESRIYLVGFSCGGNGVWKLAYENPQRFAALVPISGWARRRDNGRGTIYPPIAPEGGSDEFAAVAERVAAIPTWILHGAEDEVVRLEEARGMVYALKALDAPVRYTEMWDVAHVAAVADALQVQGLAEWMFRQQRPR